MILSYRAGRYGCLDTLNSKIHPLFQILDTDPGWYNNSRIVACNNSGGAGGAAGEEEEYIWLTASDGCGKNTAALYNLHINCILLKCCVSIYFFGYEKVQVAYGHPPSCSCGGLEGPCSGGLWPPVPLPNR